MPEENLYDGQELEQNVNNQALISQRKKTEKNQRNIENNANVVRTVANVASKTGHPVFGTIGKGVKLVDDLTGRRATKALGKGMNLANKLTPGGALAQKALNIAGGNGMLSRLGSALAKRNGNNMMSSLLGKSDKKTSDVSNLESNNETEDSSNEGDVSFENVQISGEFIKKALIAMIPISVVIIFCCLFISSTQIFINSIDLGTADSLSGTQVDDKIKSNEDNYNDEITDDHPNLSSTTVPKSDVYLYSFNSDNNYIQIADRKYNEADLTKLKDFYGSLIDYNNEEGIDMYTVYTFFFKLYDIYDYYVKEYNIKIDLPLLMSTLNLQSTNRTLIFSSNTEGYKRITSEEADKRLEEGKIRFDYTNTYDYETTAKNSKYDIEVLVQNMISTQATERCSDSTGKIVKTNIIRDNELGNQVLVCEEGQTYSVTEPKLDYDEEKYKKFLIKFIGQKYFSAKDEEELSENESLIKGKIVQIYDAKAQYEYLSGGYETKNQIIPASNKSFWWPIGSAETEEINGVLYAKGEPFTVGISSPYSYRIDPINGKVSFHAGIDIGGLGNAPGVINIIASKSGEVVYPTKDSETQFLDGDTNVGPGQSYGNYVIIKHSDGNYTLYAHLAKDSITVRAGDVVDQGQVIAKMGHSGRSTGTHLHFEVRVGANEYSKANNPLNYVDPKNPRPVPGGEGFSLEYTTLSKDEFVAKLQDYYNRANLPQHKLDSYKKNFVDHAEGIYDTALDNNLNPELVIVTAMAEQAFYLSPECQYTHNYWGIGITNGKGCNSGYKFDSIEDGVVGYANLLSQYGENGSYASSINNIYNERNAAGCDPAGHDLPGTLVGMQSLYSFIGTYRYNPGNWGIGGCVYLNHYIYDDNYCTTKITCTNYNNCPEASRTTVCEQNDYTAWQVSKKIQIRYDIFGL